jgi:hypothetical protein
MPSKSDFLVVKGENIELNGQPIILKGAGLGGWSEWCCFRHAYMAQLFADIVSLAPLKVNMEVSMPSTSAMTVIELSTDRSIHQNFITGYPGHECECTVQTPSTRSRQTHGPRQSKFVPS